MKTIVNFLADGFEGKGFWATLRLYLFGILLASPVILCQAFFKPAWGPWVIMAVVLSYVVVSVGCSIYRGNNVPIRTEKTI